MHLEELVEKLKPMPAGLRTKLEAEAHAKTAALRWLPNPGPQTLAYYSEADELYYGGEAGGGKSDLLVGLAINCHRRAAIFREFKDDARKLGQRLCEVVGSTAGWNDQMSRWRYRDQYIDFDGLPNEQDKEHHKGTPRDLHAFDEIGDFTESQYEFIIAWNRSTVRGQRCRVVATGNPPTRAKGLWVIKRWAAWLDPRHPHPAADGEIRWYVRASDGEEKEVPDAGPYDVDGEATFAKSRTFIRAHLEDNPDLARTDYDATLARLPKELRDAYRSGKFDVALRDHPFQVVPTQWVLDAQKRWNRRPPRICCGNVGSPIRLA
ncbi:MAG: terminase, partial [Steroidobacteraceae bacterium]